MRLGLLQVDTRYCPLAVSVPGGETIQTHSLTHLCDFFRDVVSSVLDFGRNDGRLRRRRRVSFLLARLGEVEGNQRDFVDGAVLVDVGVGGRAEKAGLHMVERALKWAGRK